MRKLLFLLCLITTSTCYAEQQSSSACDATDGIEKIFHLSDFTPAENYTFLNEMDVSTKIALQRIKKNEKSLYNQLKSFYNTNSKVFQNDAFKNWLKSNNLTNNVNIVIAPTTLDDYILFYFANNPSEETATVADYLKIKYKLYNVSNESLYRFMRLNEAFYSSINKTIYIGIDSYIIAPVDNYESEFTYKKEQFNQLKNNFTLAHELAHHLISKNQMQTNNSEPLADTIAFLLLNKYHQYNKNYYNDNLKLIHYMRINTKDYQPTFELINLINNNQKLFNKSLTVTQQILNLKKITRR